MKLSNTNFLTGRRRLIQLEAGRMKGRLLSREIVDQCKEYEQQLFEEHFGGSISVLE